MSAAKNKNVRNSPRKNLSPLTLDSFSSLENLEKLAQHGEVLEASSSGLLLRFQRKDFLRKDLKSNLNIDNLVGLKVYFNIHEMDLEISGKVVRTQFKGKDGFLVAVDYSIDAPEYWRECLVDLLPAK